VHRLQTSWWNKKQAVRETIGHHNALIYKMTNLKARVVVCMPGCHVL
jgi:hypothetical protein